MSLMTAVCLFLCTSHWFVLQRSKEQREWPVVLIQQLMSDVRILTPLFSFYFVCVLGEGGGGTAVVSDGCEDQLLGTHKPWSVVGCTVGGNS